MAEAEPVNVQAPAQNEAPGPVGESPFKEFDLTKESYREYDFVGRVYRIIGPVRLYYKPGATTHRVLDYDGIVHCVPAPGERGCVVRWKPGDAKDPVQF